MNNFEMCSNDLKHSVFETTQKVIALRHTKGSKNVIYTLMFGETFYGRHMTNCSKDRDVLNSVRSTGRKP